MVVELKDGLPPRPHELMCMPRNLIRTNSTTIRQKLNRFDVIVPFNHNITNATLIKAMGCAQKVSLELGISSSLHTHENLALYS